MRVKKKTSIPKPVILFMTFGPTASSGAGGSGTDLWQLIGAVPPADIELNTGAGATGINAVNPNDARVRLFLTLLGGNPFGGNFLVDGTEEMAIGVKNVGGANNNRVGMNRDDSNTGEAQEIQINGATGDVQFRNDDGVAFKTRMNATFNEINFVAQKTTTNDDVTLTIRNSPVVAYVSQITKGGVKKNAFALDESTFTLAPNDTPGTQYFMIEVNGHIRTNQIAAGAHPTPTGEYLELFDIGTGASKGFVPLFT